MRSNVHVHIHAATNLVVFIFHTRSINYQVMSQTSEGLSPAYQLQCMHNYYNKNYEQCVVHVHCEKTLRINAKFLALSHRSEAYLKEG